MPQLARGLVGERDREQRLERDRAAGDNRRIKEAEQALASKKQFLALAEQAN